MTQTSSKGAWEAYRERELRTATAMLEELGYTLEKTQVHLGGERYLMAGSRDVGGGGYKLVLMGTRMRDSARVVIKFSTQHGGIAEIAREHTCRQLLRTLKFAIWAFHMPRELYYRRDETSCMFITEYITEDTPFLKRPLSEQFFLAMRAFETQEGVHATTSEHSTLIGKTFGMADAAYYLDSFAEFQQQANAADANDTALRDTLVNAYTFLRDNKTTIERFCGFLTHADFVPNNVRITNDTVYLLDYASLHFGNKYESWARFINFMVHHNPALEASLVAYVLENRGKEEALCLRLMRTYKLGFLLQFWTKALANSEGAMHDLVKTRVAFWHSVLTHVLDDTSIPAQLVETFLTEEAALRSQEEYARQRELIGTNMATS